jgi:hypothetical protein
MILHILIDDDYVQIEREMVPRPVHISRSRWKTMWERLECGGLTYERLLEIDAAMMKEPSS